MVDFDEYKDNDVFFIVDAKFYSALDPENKFEANFLELYARVVNEKGSFLDLENIVLAVGDHYKKPFGKGKLNKKYIIFSGIDKKED